MSEWVDVPWENGDWEDPYEDLYYRDMFAESAEEYQRGWFD